MKRKVKKIPAAKVLISKLIIFAVIFYQLALPFSLVKFANAEEPTTSTEETQPQPEAQSEPTPKPEPEQAQEITTKEESSEPETSTTEDSTPSNDETVSPDETSTQDPTTDETTTETPNETDESTETDTVDEPIINDIEISDDMLIDENPNEEQGSTDSEITNNNDINQTTDSNSDSNTGDNIIVPTEKPEETTVTNETGESSNQNAEQQTADEDENDQTDQANLITPPNTGLVASANDVPKTPTSSITTGDSNADSLIVNETNTNVVGENYLEAVINIVEDTTGDINLLDEFQNLIETAKENVVDPLVDLVINNNNDADLTNNATADANTGKNLLESKKGSSEITTGNATATADVVNIVNQNLIGNSWLFAIINVIGNWTGNLIVPGEGVLKVPAGQLNALEVSNENNAEVNNNATANANSGDNSAYSKKGKGSITTGDVASSVDVKDIINTNIISNNWFFLLINNMGTWTGKILGWDQADQNYDEVYSYEFESEPTELMNQDSSVKVHNNNKAKVTNNAASSANTGSNTLSTKKVANISTGDATATSNIFNLINTNIIGNNWMFGIVNIMGKWTGDTIFAYPDLAVNIESDDTNVTAGDPMEYKITVTNEGEADSEDTNVMIPWPENLTYDSASETPAAGQYNWNIGDLPSGESKTFAINAIATEQEEQVSVQLAAAVSTPTNEKVIENNSASFTSVIQPKKEDANTDEENGADEESDEDSAEDVQPIENQELDSKMKITRLNESPENLTIGSTITNVIYIENTGDSTLHDVEVKDVIKEPSGEAAGENSWSFEELEKDEKMKIEYQLVVNPSAETGNYSYQASAVGYNELDEKIKSNESKIKLAIYVPQTDQIYTGEPFSLMSANDQANDNEEDQPEMIVAATGSDWPKTPIYLLLAALIGYLAYLNRKKLRLYVKKIPMPKFKKRLV
jgi:uncharacterized repeat protein (TIGR01451 family)